MNAGCTKRLSDHTLAVCENGDEYCRTCTGNNCNSKSSIEEYLECDTEKSITGEIVHGMCIACNSAIDPMCATNVTFDVFEACPNLVNSSRCYHLINATTGEHSRGDFSPTKFYIKL